MSLTKSQLRSRVIQLADAVGSQRWETTPGGEVDQHIGIAMDREWKRILNANPYYRVARRTPTSDANGYYAVSDLSSGTGDATERLYRVIAFAVDNVVYEEGRLSDYLLPNAGAVQPNYVYYFEGTQLMALPKTASKAADVVVNWLPQRHDQLAGESSGLDFPDGYENVIAWSAAAMLLNKGAVEAGAAQVLEYQAEQLRQDMLQDLARRSTNPIKLRYADDRSDWAG